LENFRASNFIEIRWTHQSSINNIMPIGKTTEESTRTGVYLVKESGLEFEHLRSETCPKDGKEYLERFR
jgi:hypothetical protein